MPREPAAGKLRYSAPPMKQFAAPKTPPDPPSGETWLSVGLPVFIVVAVVALACVAAYYRNSVGAPLPRSTSARWSAQ